MKTIVKKDAASSRYFCYYCLKYSIKFTFNEIIAVVLYNL